MKPVDLVKKYGTVAAASKKTGFHRRTIYYWIAKGTIPTRSQQYIQYITAKRI